MASKRDAVNQAAAGINNVIQNSLQQSKSLLAEISEEMGRPIGEMGRPENSRFENSFANHNGTGSSVFENSVANWSKRRVQAKLMEEKLVEDNRRKVQLGTSEDKDGNDKSLNDKEKETPDTALLNTSPWKKDIKKPTRAHVDRVIGEMTGTSPKPSAHQYDENRRTEKQHERARDTDVEHNASSPLEIPAAVPHQNEKIVPPKNKEALRELREFFQPVFKESEEFAMDLRKSYGLKANTEANKTENNLKANDFNAETNTTHDTNGKSTFNSAQEDKKYDYREIEREMYSFDPQQTGIDGKTADGRSRINQVQRPFFDYYTQDSTELAKEKNLDKIHSRRAEIAQKQSDFYGNHNDFNEINGGAPGIGKMGSGKTGSMKVGNPTCSAGALTWFGKLHMNDDDEFLGFLAAMHEVSVEQELEWLQELENLPVETNLPAETYVEN